MRFLCYLLGHHWIGYGDPLLRGKAWMKCGRCRKRKTIAVLLLLVSLPASADWEDKVSDVLLFATGFVSGLVVHEAGHILAAKMYGEELDWVGTKWMCRYPCEDISKVALAGNLTTAIVGETLLHMPYKGPFVDGMQAFNTVNPISYAIMDSVTSGGYGDYRHVDDRVQVALAIHAATIGYRQFSGRWSVAPKKNGIQVRVNF